MNTSHSLVNSYYAFCIVFVTVMLSLLVGIVLFVILENLGDRFIEWLRYRRQSRQSREYLKEVIGHIDEMHEDEEGVQAKGILYHTNSPVLVGPLSLYTRTSEPRAMTHFTLTEDGELINNFPEGVPPVDNRGS